MIKIRTINSTLAALSLGALATACGGIEPSSSVDQAGFENSDPTLSADSLGTTDEAVTVCDDHQYDHWRYMADLGVATAMELGRWQPKTDFVFTGTYTGVALSATGLARCVNGCPNVQAILSLQTNGTGVIPRHDANLLRSKMQTAWERQGVWDQNNPLVDHQLTATTMSTATCGARYWYRATTNSGGSGGTTATAVSGTASIVFANSNSCVDVIGVSTADGALMQQYACSASNANQKFTFESVSGAYRLKATHSGKCMRAVGNWAYSGLEQRTCDTSNNQLFDVVPTSNGKYQLKNRAGGMCVEVANYSTANGAQVIANNCNASAANQQVSLPGATASTTTSGGTSGTTTDLANPGALVNAIQWLGGTDNTYLAFQTNGAEVSIDPTGTMVDGSSTTQSGSCFVGTSLYDATRTSGGKCCTYDGIYGVLTQTTFNKSIYACK